MGRMPTQEPAFQKTRHHVSCLPQQRVKADAQEHDVGLQKIASVHRHVPDPVIARDGFRYDQRQPHNVLETRKNMRQVPLFPLGSWPGSRREQVARPTCRFPTPQ